MITHVYNDLYYEIIILFNKFKIKFKINSRKASDINL